MGLSERIFMHCSRYAYREDSRQAYVTVYAEIKHKLEKKFIIMGFDGKKTERFDKVTFFSLLGAVWFLESTQKV